MKNKFITLYGIIAILILFSSVGWFAFSITDKARNGTDEAEKSFAWLSREAVSASLSDGFMTDAFIRDLTSTCQKSRLLSAIVINTPSGSVFAWPENASAIAYGMDGSARISDTSLFMKAFSTSLDIGDGASGSVVMTAVLYVLHPDDIFSASRNSFLVILVLLLGTIIAIFILSPAKKEDVEKSEGAAKKAAVAVEVSPAAVPEAETVSKTAAMPENPDGQFAAEPESVAEASFGEEPAPEDEERELAAAETETEAACSAPSGGPEGLFSAVTGIGWEPYLLDRLDAELVRAASSEQDLSLIIVRVSGLLHTDLLSRKIAKVLLETFRFRDMVFEYGTDGFAGIMQNVNLDEAMKTADSLYAGMDSILMEMEYEGKITIGITTRTARLLPASRMIEEAASAAKKAEEEPSLPIVAFRANPEKYRNFVAENG